MSDQDPDESVHRLALMFTGYALPLLVELTQSAHPAIRRQARRLLRQVATKLHDAGQDISRWTTAPPNGRPN
jgi:hypothetical protein